VQQGTVNRQPADADSQNQDPHVLHAGIRQHPLEIALPDHEYGRHRHHKRPIKIMKLAGSIGFGAGLTDLGRPQNRQEGEVGDAPPRKRPTRPGASP